MKDLEFVASDFTAAPTGNAGAMAMWVNTKLARKLEKALVVFGNHGRWNENAIVGLDTHTGKLVCVEEINK